MKLIATVGTAILTARLNDSPAARDFAAMLPMTLDLRDFHEVEKIADLSRRLTIAGGPGHHTPVAGDIAYYAPWANLALFYGGAGRAAGLVPLGRFDGGTAQLRTATRIHITLQKD